MDAQVYVTLFDYNAWVNHRVWDCIESLSDAQFDQPIDYSQGSIHNQIAHVMEVEYWWFRFLRTGELQFASEADLATRASIRARWDEIERMIREYVAALTPEELAREVKPPFWEPELPSIKVFEALFQVANHSLDHRAQILSALHRFGAPTTPQDFIFYKFDRAGVAWTND